MATREILSTYIKKLGHPLQEIRERALQLLIVKLQLGWELEDELSSTRELLDALLAWFHVHTPTLQKEALKLLLNTVKSKSGAYIVREKGVKEILSTLSSCQHKIEEDASELFEDIVETLRFINTVQSQESLSVPRLNIQSNASSDNESIASGYFHLGQNLQSSRDTSVSNHDVCLNPTPRNDSPEGITILLLPWADLCQSDVKTIQLIENALRVLKSTRRCCRFIRDVFLRDFTAEIFLNRPNIVQSVVSLATCGDGGKVSEPLHVLLCVTAALRARIHQLSCLDLVHQPLEKVPTEHKDSDHFDIELDLFSNEAGFKSPGPSKDDGLELLRQMPVPLFALDTLLAILSAMARSVVLIDPDTDKEVLDMNELNLCTSLIEQLISLLLVCVSDHFWSAEHSTKTHRDIAHKSCMAMRQLGDLTSKYRSSYINHTSRNHHRVHWLRLVSCSVQLAQWCRHAAMPSKALVISLQYAMQDQALQMYCPKIWDEVKDVLMGKSISIDKEYQTKYRELTKLFQSIDEAVRFIKNKDGCRNSKTVLSCIKNSLPILDLHANESFLADIGEVVLKKIRDWDMNDDDWSLVRSISLTLMAHEIVSIREKVYAMLLDVVKEVLVGDEDKQDVEKSLTLLCDVGVLTEICCHGLCDKSEQVSRSAMEVMTYALRMRLAVCRRRWALLLSSLLPVLPLLHVYAHSHTDLGQAIIKSLEVEIAECMGVPQAEVMYGLVRLLFLKSAAVRMDAAHSLCHLLDDSRYLPPRESLRADVLLAALGRVQPAEFNAHSARPAAHTPQASGLIDILDVLKQDITLSEDDSLIHEHSNKSATLEPSLRRATLQQLSVLMQRTELHDTFVMNQGVSVIIAILRMSLLVEDYLAFPECAISCVSVLNSVCFSCRHTLAKVKDLPALLLRVIMIFPANESTVSSISQLLCVLAWSGFALQQVSGRGRQVALPSCVVDNTELPMHVHSYWTNSPNAPHSTVEWLQASEEWRSAIRIRWSVAWLGAAPLLHSPAPDPVPAPPGPLALRVTSHDVATLKDTNVVHACGRILMAMQNATQHSHVIHALELLESYTRLIPVSSISVSEWSSLPWSVAISRYMTSSPASPRDVTLLIALLNYVQVYMDFVPDQDDTMKWIKTSFFDANTSIISLLSRDQLYPQQSNQDYIEITQLHISIVRVILRCVVTADCRDAGNMESLLKILLVCLDKVDLKNFHMLGYLNEILRCIRYITNWPHLAPSEEILTATLRGACGAAGGAGGAGDAGGGPGARRGRASRLNALLSLLAVVKCLRAQDVAVQRWSEHFSGNVMQSVTSCVKSRDVTTRAAALQLMASLAHYAQLLPQLLCAIESDSLSQFAASILCDKREANAVRCGAAALLTALTARSAGQADIYEADILHQLQESDFVDNCLEVLVDFCNEKEYKSIFPPNISLSLLERRSQLEVRAQKTSDLRIEAGCPTPETQPPPPPLPTPSLVVALSDLVYNVVAFDKCPVVEWNEQGIFRLLFRCTSWSSSSELDNFAVREASSRALTRAAELHKKVRLTLANTQDCLHGLIVCLTSIEQDECSPESLSFYSEGLLLLGTLLPERGASETVWREMQDGAAENLLVLLLQGLVCDHEGLQEASMYCLTQLTQSIFTKKNNTKCIERNRASLLDNTRSPYYERDAYRKLSSGDGDCLPEYLVEEICKALLGIYAGMPLEKKKFQCAQDDVWSRTCLCIASLFATSERARAFAVHREFTKQVLGSLQGIRDHLSVQGKTADVIRNANTSPVLRCLNWLLVVISCMMVDSGTAKESFAESGLAVSLNRLWPWCMITDLLRASVVHLLLLFTNGCPKACSAMCACVGGQSLVGALCALASRSAARGEAAGGGAARGEAAVLPLALRTLRHTLDSAHAVALLLQSNVLSCVHKVLTHWRANSRECLLEWARLAERVSRWPDGAASLLDLKQVLCAAHTRAHLMPVVANIAHFHRVGFLQSAELMEAVCAALLRGECRELVAAARAAWALAANNHKTKLQLRSAGVTSAVASALERIQRTGREREPNSAERERAEQLLTYLTSVLHSG